MSVAQGDVVRARDELRRIGDRMQSEASRVLEWLREHGEAGASGVPYEVAMAAHGCQAAIDEWTAARRAEAKPSAPA